MKTYQIDVIRAPHDQSTDRTQLVPEAKYVAPFRRKYLFRIFGLNEKRIEI